MIMTELLFSMVLTKSQRQKVNRMRENQFEAVNISNSFKDFCPKDINSYEFRKASCCRLKLKVLENNIL